MTEPLAIDLFCGLGGWSDGLLAEGFRVIGFDIERHVYGEHRYPAQLVIQDVMTLDGSQFRTADIIVASPPCQEYSYMAMPWSRAKQIEADYKSGVRDTAELTALFDACFRIQREACAAAGRHIPLIVENVRGAQKWVGRARWNYGSFYLWGDVPALMPMTFKGRKTSGRSLDRNATAKWGPHNMGKGDLMTAEIESNRDDGSKTPAGNCSQAMWKDRPIARYAHPTPEEMGRHGFKVPGFRFDGSGKSFQSASVEHSGAKIGGDWFSDPESTCRKHGSKSPDRKMASAMIAKIPLPLSRHIARTFKPK